MKKPITAMIAAGVVMASGAALAADIPGGPSPYYAPPPPRVYNWAGVYAGLNLGYEWGKVTNWNIDPSGVAGGGQIGFNWQSGQFVFGGEADIQATSADDTFAPYKFSNPWFGTLRARAGYAMSNMLFYATAGLAYGDLTGELNSLDETKTELGWTAGLGMEIGFMPNWSAKVEYLYMDLGDRTFTITGVNNGYQSNLLRVGVNYHF
jgi:outer membrane immunogenic protein